MKRHPLARLRALVGKHVHLTLVTLGNRSVFTQSISGTLEARVHEWNGIVEPEFGVGYNNGHCLRFLSYEGVRLVGNTLTAVEGVNVRLQRQKARGK